MIKHITIELKETFIETANILKGHERRRFMARMAQWSDKSRLNIRLAYYPPYHGIANTIQLSVFGCLGCA